MLLYDVRLVIKVPLVVTVAASNKEAAKDKAEELFYEGKLSEKLFTALREDPGDETAVATWVTELPQKFS